MVPGASVAEIARRHGVNANLLFSWRRQHEQGVLAERTRPPRAAKMLPVRIAAPSASPSAAVAAAIEIELPCGARVRVIGDMKGKDPGIEERRPPVRLHVRAIVRDGASAFVGSQSLRKDELENRREVGLIINNPAVARKLIRVFESDWADAGKGAKAKAKAA
jgi:hypothetical protein